MKRQDIPSGDEDVRPLLLCKEDRRKFYGVLEADLPTRTKRIEYYLIALMAVTGVRFSSSLGLLVEQTPAFVVLRFLGILP